MLVRIARSGKLTVPKTFRKQPGHLLNAAYTFKLRPMSTNLYRTLVFKKKHKSRCRI